MSTLVTHLDVSIDDAEEQYLQSQKYKKINVDLNKGAGGNHVYIWYLKEHGSAPITRLQVTFNKKMEIGLTEAGYIKIDKNLNAGVPAHPVYLWYFRGCTEFDVPIRDLDVTTDPNTEAKKFRFGWERLACDLNRGPKGNWIFAWVKRDKPAYICDITAADSYTLDTDFLQEGYIRVDEDTNRNSGGAPVFIWFRQTTDPERAITDLQVSTNDQERQGVQQQGYTSVDVNLNEGAGGDKVYLWFKHTKGSKPIKAITLLLTKDAVDAYKKAGVKVIERNLNSGNRGFIEYLCLNQ